MNPIVHRVTGSEAVQPSTEHVYSAHPDPRLRMDVYPPPGIDGGRAPAVLLIHGGVPPGVRTKDAPFFRSWGRAIAASGMVGVTFSHRLGYPKANLVDAAADVASASSYVRANADALHVDPSRIALFAFSAGGPLLAAGLSADASFVRCLVAYYAFMDIRESPLHAEDGPPELLSRWSPTAHYEERGAALPPILVARAGQDAPTLNALVDRFVAVALERNAALTFVNHPDGRHGFDSLDDVPRTHEIIVATIAFLRRHLGVG